MVEAPEVLRKLARLCRGGAAERLDLLPRVGSCTPSVYLGDLCLSFLSGLSGDSFLYWPSKAFIFNFLTLINQLQKQEGWLCLNSVGFQV